MDTLDIWHQQVARERAIKLAHERAKEMVAFLSENDDKGTPSYFFSLANRIQKKEEIVNLIDGELQRRSVMKYWLCSDKYNTFHSHVLGMVYNLQKDLELIVWDYTKWNEESKDRLYIWSLRKIFEFLGDLLLLEDKIREEKRSENEE